MKKELAIAVLVALMAIVFAFCAMPKRAGAAIVIFQSKGAATASVPVATTSSRLMVGPVMAFPTRNLTEGEKWEMTAELQRQVARLAALISRLTR